MFLAFKISDIINIPFGYVMDFLYQFTNNYGLTLILFAVIVKVVLLPLTAKGKRSMMKMSRMTPELQKLQEKYKDDSVKQQQEIQALYKREGVSMFGGCLWSFIPLLILIPLYQVVRQPLVYMMHLSAGDAETIVGIITEQLPELFTNKNQFYAQMIAAAHLSEYADSSTPRGKCMLETICKEMGFDSLGYQSLDGLLEAIGLDRDKVCTYCWTGEE